MILDSLQQKGIANLMLLLKCNPHNWRQIALIYAISDSIISLALDAVEGNQQHHE